MTGTLTNPVDLAAFAAGAVLLVVLLTRLASVARRSSRARIVTVGLLVPAAMALSMSASTSFRFAGERLGITDLAERMVLCGTAEAAIIALTLHSWGAKSKASAWLAYCLVAVQAVPAFSVSGGAGGIVRIVLGPILLALMLHKLLGLELKFSGEVSTGLLATAGRELRERLVARLGIGRRGADSAAIARSRAADRAVALASRRRLGKRAAVRLAVAIDAAQHGLNEADAAGAEASIVARVVRRKSVAELHSLTARHVWRSKVLSEPETVPVEIAEPDTAVDIQASAEPVVWVRNRTIVSGRRSLRITPKAVRRARSTQVPQAAAHQPEAVPAAQVPERRPAVVQVSKTRVDTKAVVPAMRTAYPDMGVDEIADKVGVTERTVRRYLPARDDRLERANGSQV